VSLADLNATDTGPGRGELYGRQVSVLLEHDRAGGRHAQLRGQADFTTGDSPVSVSLGISTATASRTWLWRTEIPIRCRCSEHDCAGAATFTFAARQTSPPAQALAPSRWAT